MSDFRPVQKVKVSDEVLNQIKQQILSGKFSPDEKLPPEGQLCELFGVSRISIRTALHKLEAIGLIETRNGEGTFVRGFDPGNLMLPLLRHGRISRQDILDLLVYREAVEVLGCRLAAQNGSPAQIGQLESIYRQMEKEAYANDPDAFTRSDIAFHHQIAAMSDNPFIIRTLQIVDDFFQAHLHRMNQSISLVYSLASHQALTEAIKSRRHNDAARILSRSIQASIKTVRQWPDLPPDGTSPETGP